MIKNLMDKIIAERKKISKMIMVYKFVGIRW